MSLVQQAPAARAEEENRVAEVADRLARRYPTVHRDQVAAAVADAHHEFDTARIRDFVPVLVEKRARDVLQQHARVAH